MFSFTRRRKQIDASPHLRRIIELSAVVEPASENDQRLTRRIARTLPVMVCPWNDGELDYDQVGLAFTKDIGDGGIGLLATQNEDAGDLVVGAFPDAERMNEPAYFLGKVRKCLPFCAGFWELGLEVTEYLNTDHRHLLEPLNVVVMKMCQGKR